MKKDKKNYYYTCDDCRKKYFPNADPEKMRGITCLMNGKCDYCRKRNIPVCPIRDYQYASGFGGLWDQVYIRDRGMGTEKGGDWPSGEATGKALGLLSGTELALDTIQRKTTRDIPAVLGGEE